MYSKKTIDMHIPCSTYRVQLNKDFTFKDLDNLIGYLHDLGISTIYASPITMATPGSNHGYDVTDPHRINPEIGTVEELQAIAKKLKELGMSWIQDIVPNHMAFTTDNQLLMDVLERGPSSEYYHYFDINRAHPDRSLYGKLMVPVLEADRETCLQENKISLAYSCGKGFTVDYGGNQYPLSASAYRLFTHACMRHNATFTATISAIRRHSWRNTSAREWTEAKKNCLAACKVPEQAIQDCLARINEDKAQLRELLDNQYYTLTHYADTNKRINYRRFFTVNNLICLSMENEAVFNHYHSFLHELYRKGWIQGLRIDHIDGLREPGAYVQRLRNLFGSDCYIICEKILEAREDLPDDWPLQGTSGYEFLSYVSQVMTQRDGADRLLDFYKELLPDSPSYEDMVFEKKKMILCNYMAGELDNLVHYFFELRLHSPFLSRDQVKQALALIMILLPVYRIYPERFPLRHQQMQLIDETFTKAHKKDPGLKAPLELLHDLFKENPGEAAAERKLAFIKRLMQFTGPLTAKGVEDTTFYVYNPLISHNEVGDSPRRLGISLEEFHSQMQTRQQMKFLPLNATSTHDTKRGEDTRIQINLLCEMAEEWQKLVKEWLQINKPLAGCVNGKPAPSLNEEYFLYQSLAGGYPAGAADITAYTQRLKDYFIKALREAKVNSSWNSPDETYEAACLRFIDKLFDSSHSFLQTFLPFRQKIASRAFTYSLNQALIKITAPGIPDFYQGTEFWDLSYVDPDNRTPVDFTVRKQVLAGIVRPVEPLKKTEVVITRKSEGYEKLYTIRQALLCRKKYSQLFTRGDYIPLYTPDPSSILAYARTLNNKWIITIAPLQLPDAAHPTTGSWKNIFLQLPPGAPATWTNLLTGEDIHIQDGKLAIADAFRTFIPALLENK